MNADQYLDYLIDTAKLHAAGDTSIGIQPSELVALKAIFASEKAKLTLNVNKNGNPA
jgi:hypothetical protein